MQHGLGATGEALSVDTAQLQTGVVNGLGCRW